jgi:hypothetical protein
MDYELAKQLKDAGFPFDKRCEYAYETTEDGLGECAYCDRTTLGFGGHVTLLPTLSELIEALGEDFSALKVYHEPEVEWVAMTEYKASFIEQNYRAKTPEEAVAKLWIAIHTPPTKDSKDMID